MIIYKLTFPNGKSYIGQTTLSLLDRYKSHIKEIKRKRLKNKSVLYKAMKKHTFFSIEIIDTARDIEELNTKEHYWINQLNTLVPYGYNLETGGNHKQLHKQSKLKISKSLKKYYQINKHPWKGRKHKKESKLKLSQAHKNKKLSKKTKQKMSKAHKGKVLSQQIIDNMVKAQNKPKILKLKKLNGAKKTIGTIGVYDIHTKKLLKTYYNIKQCSTDLKIDVETVRHGIKNIVKNPRKYIFKLLTQGYKNGNR